MRPPRLVALLALALAGCAVRGTPGPAEPLRVLVYNIHAGTDADRGDNLQRVADLVRTTGADLALLQEVDSATRRSDGVDQLAELVRLTGFHGAFGRTLDYQGGGYGLAVLSRWPILSDTLIPLPVEPAQERAGGSYEPRGALRVRVEAPGGPIGAITTHLDAGRADVYRRQEVETVLRAAAEAEAPLTLVGGDFNAEPGSLPIERMESAGWVDAWEACGEGEGHTFPAGEPVKRIDYLFLPAGGSCASAAVLATDASDHRPLLVVVPR